MAITWEISLTDNSGEFNSCSGKQELPCFMESKEAEPTKFDTGLETTHIFTIYFNMICFNIILPMARTP
jgi:hypothetical protein